MLKAEKSILSRVRKKIKKRISFLESKEIIIEPMSSYDKVGILGGAALAKRELK